MTGNCLSNFKKIDHIVSNHFSLSNSGLELFLKTLHNRDEKLKFIDPKFHEFLDEDFRIKYKVSDDATIEADNGWKLFNSIFIDFVHTFDMKYENFSKNKIKVNKQEMRLFKFMKSWYNDIKKPLRKDAFLERACLHLEELAPTEKNNFEIVFKRATEEIGYKKIPETKSELVISFNFADWFLCSTNEGWGSCLSLESDYENCFWAGLPGLITDPNRMLIYTTDGRKKEYQGISVDKFVSRSWALLGRNDLIYLVRHYPSQVFNGPLLNKTTQFYFYEGAPLVCNNSEFPGGKYPYKHMITNIEGKGISIYQDGTIFKIGKNKKGEERVYVKGEGGGFYYVNNYESGRNLYVEDGSDYFFTRGLSYLIDDGRQIHEASGECGDTCYVCGDRVHEDDIYEGLNGEIYCESCFNEYYSSCDTCGCTIDNDDVYYSPGGDTLCEHHFERNYFSCHSCGEPGYNEEVIEYEGRQYCQSCAEDFLAPCNICGTWVDNTSLNVVKKGADEIYICEGCSTTCKTCETVMDRYEAREVDGRYYCEDCYRKKFHQPSLFEQEPAEAS